MSKKKNSLSKSTLIRSIQCAKSLYLYKNFYNLRDKPSVVQQQRFDRGHRIGKLAHQLFPNGKDCSPPNPFSYDESVAATKLLIQQQFPAIYEAAFKNNGILVALDILALENGKWYAYEVKSSLRISNTYLLDAAIQYYVITQSGIPLEDFFIININSDYLFDGTLSLNEFFKKTSLLESIKERIPFVEQTIEQAIETLNRATVPEVPIGAHCTKPYPCDFIGYCWKDIPKNAIWNIPEISIQEKNIFVEQGINTIDQINNTDELNFRQKIIIDSYKSGSPFWIKDKIAEFLKPVQYPLFYFDIEAFQPAIPLFKQTHPYERIPFLYSLHYKESENAPLQHSSYISPVGEDNRLAFIEHFLRATELPGRILVFNTLLEKGILFRLTQDFPQYKNQILDRINRIIDIEIPFKEMYYYHPAQQGSFSLKTVGNIMLGINEYSNGSVKDGEEAMAIYNELFYCNTPEEIPIKLQQLQEYCYTDTYVLYKVVEQLKKLASH